MKKELKTLEIYIANDGKEFTDEKEAIKYEETVLKRLSNIEYYCISYCPDLTEGRGYYKKLFVALENPLYSKKIILDLFCEQALGSKVAWVQGCSPMENWTYAKVEKQEFDNYKHYNSYQYLEVNRIFISFSELEGFPKPLKYPTNEKEKFDDYKNYIET
jgi:hypothetical protein